MEWQWAPAHTRGSRIRSGSALKPLPSHYCSVSFCPAVSTLSRFFLAIQGKSSYRHTQFMVSGDPSRRSLPALTDNNLLPGSNPWSLHCFRNLFLLCGPETTLPYLDFCLFISKASLREGCLLLEQISKDSEFALQCYIIFQVPASHALHFYLLSYHLLRICCSKWNCSIKDICNYHSRSSAETSGATNNIHFPTVHKCCVAGVIYLG